jgi:hypothetical protein
MAIPCGLLSSMPLIENGAEPGKASDPTVVESAREMSRNLHQLALRYWSDGRRQDARRVALEAGRILRPVDADSELMTQITSTLEGLRRESD